MPRIGRHLAHLHPETGRVYPPMSAQQQRAAHASDTAHDSLMFRTAAQVRLILAGAAIGVLAAAVIALLR